MHVSWCSLIFPGNCYSQGGHEQANAPYLELRKIDIKVKWDFVHVREFGERSHLILGWKFV